MSVNVLSCAAARATGGLAAPPPGAVVRGQGWVVERTLIE
jgi:hypothetical protein